MDPVATALFPLRGLGGAARRPVLVPARPTSSGSFAERRIRHDDSGAVLLLAGLLLVLGFIVLAGVVLTTKDLDEVSARSERGSILTPADVLVGEFNQTVRNVVAHGDTNITDYKERAARAEASLKAGAVTRGLYLDVRLDPSPDPAIFWRDSRCGAYDSTRSQDGIIIGYDLDTAEETIVGAVYDIHVTDGRQTLRFPYYVKLHDCLPSTQNYFFSDWTLIDGQLTNAENAQNANDSNAAARIEELPVGTLVVEQLSSPLASSLSASGWTYPEYTVEDDLLTATHPATPLNDWMTLKIDNSNIPNNVALTNVRLRIDAYHVARVDDNLQVRVLNGANVMLTQIIPTGLLQQTFWYDLPTSPSGSATWTKQELGAVTVEFQVIEVGMFDPPAFFHVEYVAADYDYVLPEKYTLDVSFGWPTIPAIYDQHAIEIRYQSDPQPTENYLLEVWDGTGWNTRLTLAPTGAGAWSTLSYTLQANEVTDGDLRVRVRDATNNDNWPGDEDVLYIDWMRLSSSFTP